MMTMSSPLASGVNDSLERTDLRNRSVTIGAMLTIYQYQLLSIWDVSFVNINLLYAFQSILI